MLNNSIQLKIYSQTQVKDTRKKQLSIYRYTVNYTIDKICQENIKCKMHDIKYIKKEVIYSKVGMVKEIE